MIRTHDLCDTGAVLWQLSYQANWELATVRVCDIPVDREEYMSIHESSYLLQDKQLAGTFLFCENDWLIERFCFISQWFVMYSIYLYNNSNYSRILMVLAYDLLENRRTIDVIITKLFFLCFKKAGNLENLDNTLSDWAKDKVQKNLVEVLTK